MSRPGIHQKLFFDYLICFGWVFQKFWLDEFSIKQSSSYPGNLPKRVNRSVKKCSNRLPLLKLATLGPKVFRGSYRWKWKVRSYSTIPKASFRTSSEVKRPVAIKVLFVGHSFTHSLVVPPHSSTPGAAGRKHIKGLKYKTYGLSSNPTSWPQTRLYESKWI